MHFAMPPRKTSHPPPRLRSSRWSAHHPRRREQMKLGAALFCGILFAFWMLVRLFSSSGDGLGPAPPGTPPVVIVTVFDDTIGKNYAARIKENRDYYASRHGYKTIYANARDYQIGNTSPASWAIVPALRDAMRQNPHSTFFLHLSPHSLIMNPEPSLIEHVMEPKSLEKLMLKDKPVVPPDSVIHTFSHLRGDKIDLVLTQDGEGLCPESFILRQGEWGRFFLDVWFDPLYRSYNFQKAEGHALEHIVQWHPTILTKLALVPQRTINAYTAEIASRGGKPVTYHENDLIARAPGCEKDPSRDCEKEMEPWFNKWKSTYGQKGS